MMKSATNPQGTPMEVFDQIRASVLADRSAYWKELSMPFYGFNRPGAKISEGLRESFWLQSMMAGLPACYFCVKAFSETDLTEDLKKIDVPTLILHGDDDQIVPIAASALLSAKLVKGARLKIIAGRAARHVLDPEGRDQRRAPRLRPTSGLSPLRPGDRTKPAPRRGWSGAPLPSPTARSTKETEMPANRSNLVALALVSTLLSSTALPLLTSPVDASLLPIVRPEPHRRPS